jgi:hypothetical protein
LYYALLSYVLLFCFLGTGADVIIIDEAAHVDPNMFYKVIVPILPMQNTALCALSSPEGQENYFSRLMELKDPDTDQLFFNVVNCFQICSKCMKLEDDAARLACRHVKQSAFWLDSRKTQRIKLLYKTNPGLALRELGGLVVSDYLPAFRKEEIAWAFEENERVTLIAAPKTIFIACDPTGGGPSEMAICSAYFAPSGEFVVRIFFFTILSCIRWQQSGLNILPGIQCLYRQKGHSILVLSIFLKWA